MRLDTGASPWGLWENLPSRQEGSVVMSSHSLHIGFLAHTPVGNKCFVVSISTKTNSCQLQTTCSPWSGPDHLDKILGTLLKLGHGSSPRAVVAGLVTQCAGPRMRWESKSNWSKVRQNTLYKILNPSSLQTLRLSLSFPPGVLLTAHGHLRKTKASC